MIARAGYKFILAFAPYSPMNIIKGWRTWNVMEKIGGWTTIFLFLGALFTLLGALSGARDQAKDAGDLKTKSDQLAAKSDEIARLTKINADVVTGGNSFCFLRLIPGPNGDGHLTVEHHGDFPVYDVSAIVNDFSLQHVTHNPDDPMVIAGENHSFIIGNVIAGWTNTLIGDVHLPDNGTFRYVVLINARNGKVTEEITGTRHEGGQWHIRITVSRFDTATNKDIILYQDPPAFSTETQPA